MSDKDKENINKSITISNRPGFFDIYNRTYRLIAAVFVVVKLMDSENDLRQRIEKLALSIMSLCVRLKDSNEQNSISLNQDIERYILEIMSFIDVASLSGFISTMNGAILKQEFQAFLSELALYIKSITTEQSAAVHDILKTNFVENSINETKTFEKDNRTNFGIGPDKTLGLGEGDRFPVGHDKGHKRKDTRKTLIYEYLEKHSDVSIRDIVPNIRGCSEKTVQRELLDLIKEGKVKKTGERRWSRYSVT